MIFKKYTNLLNLRLITLLILCWGVNMTSFAQAKDSTPLDSLHFNIRYSSVLLGFDSLKINFHARNQIDYVWELAPACHCLKLKNGKFYLKNDSISYNGSCVVTNIKNNNCNEDYHFSLSYNNKFLLNGLFMCHSNEYIKIVSTYSDGKRSGARYYLNKKGNLLKTEIYENGVLLETIY